MDETKRLPWPPSFDILVMCSLPLLNEPGKFSRKPQRSLIMQAGWLTRIWPVVDLAVTKVHKNQQSAA
jgi:hypothetical protein